MVEGEAAVGTGAGEGGAGGAAGLAAFVAKDSVVLDVSECFSRPPSCFVFLWFITGSTRW